MTHPAFLLLVAAGIAGLGCLLLWPRRGLVPWLRQALRRDEREKVEDALKHLYDSEYLGAPGSIQSLAGALELSTTRVTALASRLEASGLVRTEDVGLKLTAEGRDYALRIIRIHRLWETYLADRTGFAEAEWHFEADRREHKTSTGQLQQLVRTTGNPRFDPHGDPIPTEEGEVPVRRGVPLTDCLAGALVTIIHVEDEPEAVYAQLREKKIRVNQRLKVLKKSPLRILVDVDGDEHALAPIVAGNVWVTPVPKGAPSKPTDHLSSLQVGETREIVGISPVCQGLQRRRLLDLGMVPGTEVTAVMKSPAGDPTGYRVRGAVIALRQNQAELIQVQRAPAGEDVL